jgi:hypothetical protein
MKRQIFTAWALTAIFSVGSGLIILNSAFAGSTNLLPETANQIKANKSLKAGKLNPVPIPPSELPPPLDAGVVFREISSGGITGRTYETVLRSDGVLIRVRIGDANDSERSVRRVSLEEVRRFQRALERFRFGNFKNLSYPAPSGAADFITYTLTSKEGTVQYNEASSEHLPQNLLSAIAAWEQIKNSQTSQSNTHILHLAG